VGLVGQVSSWRGQVVAGKQVLGVAEDLPRLLRDHQVDELIFTSGTVAHLLQQAVRGPRGKRLRVRLVPGSFAALVEGRSIVSVDDLPLIEVNPRC
jgi:hypothetical protein